MNETSYKNFVSLLYDIEQLNKPYKRYKEFNKLIKIYPDEWKNYMKCKIKMLKI